MPALDSLDQSLAVEYTRIVLGMDELFRTANADDKEASFTREGLVPINLTTETPHAYKEWAHVRSDLDELQRRYLAVGDDVRRNYMQQQIGSLRSLADWSAGQPSTFRDKVRNFLYVNENPYTAREQSLLHEKLDAALTAKGYQGTLHAKVRAWEADRRVPAQQVESVLRELLAAAKQRVVQMMFPQMADVEVTPVVVCDVPYNAYCDYVGGKMYINGDLSYSYEALKHLVTHECFPGHTTHMRIRELGVAAGEIPLDAALVITNTASSSVFEGIADNGIDFIRWADTADDQIFAIYQKIRSISGMNAAHMIHSEQKPLEDVSAFLERFAFGEENWIASRLRFFQHFLRAPFIYSYWRGNEAVRAVYQRVPEADRKRFYQFLYTNMLSSDTVKQFV